MTQHASRTTRVNAFWRQTGVKVCPGTLSTQSKITICFEIKCGYKRYSVAEKNLRLVAHMPDWLQVGYLQNVYWEQTLVKGNFCFNCDFKFDQRLDVSESLASSINNIFVLKKSDDE